MREFPKETPMQHNSTKATQALIHNLIAIAQANSSEHAHDKAIYTLWDIFGDYFMTLIAKNSSLANSDFTLNGCSPKERKANLAGDAYMAFCKIVQDFDPNKNVPFEAYFANKIRWHIADEKRNNAKHTKREKCTDFSLESNSCSNENSYEELDMFNTLRSIQSDDDFEEDCYRRDGITAIQQILKNAPKLQKYFNITQEICNDHDSYSDAEAARRLGCTRANIGQLRKKLIQLLIENGLAHDCHMLMAA